MDARSASHAAAKALDELCAVYRPPVLAYVRRQALGAAEAEDVTQAFFEQVLRLRTHAAADPQRGRFRVFLLVALRHFLANHAAFTSAAKRGGGQALVSLDDTDAVATPIAHDNPEAAFERDWAALVVRNAVARLQAEAQSANKLPLFRALQGYLLEAPDREDYAQAAASLGLRRNTLAVAIHRLRQRLRELIREELSDTVTEPDQLEDELSTLQQALATPLQGQ